MGVEPSIPPGGQARRGDTRRVAFSPEEAAALADAVAIAQDATACGAGFLAEERRILEAGARSGRPVVFVTTEGGARVFGEILDAHRRLAAIEDQLLATSAEGLDVLTAADLVVQQAEIQLRRSAT